MDELNNTKKAKIALSISKYCNNNCIYCFRKDKYFISNGGNPKNFIYHDEIKKELEKHQENCNAVIFTGNEPTLNNQLLDFIKLAKNMNYDVEIYTNGRMFSNKFFCDKILSEGVNVLLLSLPSSIQSDHDKITRVKGSFKQTIKAIKNILKFINVDLKIVIVITKINYFYLKDIVIFLKKLGIKKIQFNAVASFDKDIVIHFEEIKNKLIEAIELALKHNIKLGVYEVPPCILGKYWYLSNQWGIPETYISIDLKKESLWRKSQRIKLKKCQKCRLNLMCEGVRIQYYNLFGENSINSVI
jgi:MoaA/NifB/PqqE/SkfB family radical SAM enzyme